MRLKPSHRRLGCTKPVSYVVMDLIPLFTYFGLVFVAIVKPGPGIAFFTTVTLSDGFKSGVIALLGCASSHVLICFALFLGFDATRQHAGLIHVIQIISLIFLFFYGLKYLLKPSSPKSIIKDFLAASEGVDHPDKAKRDLIRFLKGVVWPFTNPFNYVMYGSLIPILVANPTFFEFEIMVLLALMTGTIVFMGVFPYIVIANKVIQYIQGPTLMRYMHKATGIFCILIAISFLPGLFSKLQNFGFFSF